MIVRAALKSDVDAIVSMGGRFYATTSYHALAPFDPAAVRELVMHMLGSGVLLVADSEAGVVGMVGLVLAPMPFNHSVMFAHEVMWWVDPEARSRGAGKALLQAVEQACRERGADVIQMVHLSNSPPEAGAIYERAGYAHTESSYSKRL